MTSSISWCGGFSNLSPTCLLYSTLVCGFQFSFHKPKPLGDLNHHKERENNRGMEKKKKIGTVICPVDPTRRFLTS